jgi:hypothetical protein
MTSKQAYKSFEPESCSITIINFVVGQAIVIFAVTRTLSGKDARRGLVSASHTDGILNHCSGSSTVHWLR